MLLSEAFENYLETESAQKSRGTERADERFFSICLHYFKDVRGLYWITEVKTEDLERFGIWLQSEQKCGIYEKEPWMDTTIAHSCQKLKAVFNKAEMLEDIPRNPAKWWRVPKGESRERRPMSDDEYAALAKNVPEWFLPILNTLRLTGARGASLATLEWQHVDFVNNRLTLISKKGGRKKRKQIIVPMSEPLRKILLNLSMDNCFGHVFLDDRGQPVTAAQIATVGSVAKRKAKLPDNVVLYSLRHGFGTRLVEAGVSPDVIRRLMGHSNLNQQLTYQKFASLEPLEAALSAIQK